MNRPHTHLAHRSLPHRQLRKKKLASYIDRDGSPPHRQLRKLGLLFDPLDVASIADSSVRATQDEELALRVRERGPEFAAEHTWDATGQGLVRACREALNPY